MAARPLAREGPEPPLLNAADCPKSSDDGLRQETSGQGQGSGRPSPISAQDDVLNDVDPQPASGKSAFEDNRFPGGAPMPQSPLGDAANPDGELFGAA